MAKLITEPEPPPPPPPSFNSISIPNQTPIGEMMTDLGFPIDADGEFELTFDGMDDLYFPSENESFLIPSNQEQFGDFTPQLEPPRDSVVNDVDKSLGCCNQESPRVCVVKDVESPLSSQGSGNCGSDVSTTNVVVDQKVKVENFVTKRKKEVEEGVSDESRNSKYRRSGDDDDNSGVTGEEDEKKRARLMRNRESAQLSRQRKKHYVEELEEKVRNMHTTITDLNGKISYFIAENANLRQQLGGNNGNGNVCPPMVGVYPPMVYPWMPMPPYMVKGSQVPLIPIPRLKPVSSSGVGSGKGKSKKSESSKTKKVASVSVLGLVFCWFLFGALAPSVNVNYGGISGAFYGNYRSNYVTDQMYNQHRGRVLETSCTGSGGTGKNVNATESSVPPGNGSEPLVASLFVPRNDKLVKIDGNLIINSILASEKAVASRKASESNERKGDLAIPKDYSPALPLPDVGRTEEMAKRIYRSTAEKQKALSSGSADTLKDQFKTKAANGEMQQWFREGVAGPMFSSGMCTEVFQFDVSSTSGAIIPASSATNVTTERSKNATETDKRKNRRILRGIPIPLPGTNFNLTEEHQRNSSSK